MIYCMSEQSFNCYDDTQEGVSRNTIRSFSMEFIVIRYDRYGTNAYRKIQIIFNKSVSAVKREQNNMTITTIRLERRKNEWLTDRLMVL